MTGTQTLQRSRLHTGIVAFAFLVTLPLQADAQDRWIKQSPFPTDRSLNGVHAFDGSRAIFCGQTRTLLETKDMGRTWITHMAGAYGTDPFYAVRFRDATNGMVVGNNNDAWRTTNGTTWTQLGTVQAGSWYHIDYTSASNVFIGANGACMASSDGGATWSLRSGYPSCPVMYCMDFKDTNVGLAGGWQSSSNEEGIFKTSDGGRNWVRKYTNSCNAVVWMSEARAIADQGTTMLQSTDSGETWQTIGYGITSGVLSMARAGDTDVVCGVSGKGDIWRSADGGFTWNLVLDGLGALPVEWNIHFADALNGWVVGDIGFIFVTHDGGQTWTEVNNGCGAQITDIHLLDANYGLAVGHNGYIFRTTNGGKFWEMKKLEVTGQIWGRDEDLIALDIVDRQFAVAAGPGGTVFKTEDGGDNWISIGYPSLSGDLWLYDIDFIDHNLGYIYGVDQAAGHTHFFFRTRDGGQTWEWVDLGQRGGGTTVQFIDSQTGWISADNAFGQRTIDGGQTWLDFYMPTYFTGPEVSKVRFLDRQRGWVVGWDGYAAKTSDGGASWTLVNMGTTSDHFFDVVPLSASEAWVCGREAASFAGVMYHTTNGGQTWTRQVVGVYPSYPYRVWALPSGEVSYAGFAGIIYRNGTRVSGTVALGDFSASLAGRQVIIDLVQAGNAVESVKVNLDATGRYSFDTSRRGATVMHVKASHWLAKNTASIDLGATSVTAPAIALVNGDVDGDNEVAIGDYSLLSLAYGSTSGDVNWNGEADLDGDGEIAIADFAILSSHFGQFGD